jgi:uncharacterized protein YndB with AHSA1/START domain
MSVTQAAADDFVISRTFDAPRDAVWRAWTDPAALAKWWGPKGCAIRVITLDPREGGMFHYAMGFQPGQEMFGRFIYRELIAPERIVFVNSFSDAAGGITRAPFPQLKNVWPLEVLNVMTLTQEGRKTRLDLRGHPINATDDERKAFAGHFDSMRQGFGGTFDQLAEYLAATGARESA